MRLPFPGHRTMAEVAETDELMRSREEGWKAGWESARKHKRLDKLLDRADRNNPPPTEPNNAA